jgi:hypothetical protein
VQTRGRCVQPSPRLRRGFDPPETVDSRKLWSPFVEPPWDFSILRDQIRLDAIEGDDFSITAAEDSLQVQNVPICMAPHADHRNWPDRAERRHCARWP